MKSTRYLLLALSFISLLTAGATASERTNPNAATPATPSGAKDEPASDSAAATEKKWITGGSLGAATTAYEGPVKSQIADHRLTTGSNKTAAYFFEGFFGWRMSNHKTIIGPSLSIISDSYDSEFLPDLNVGAYFVSFMVQHYFAGDLHRGLFLRLDAGLAGISIGESTGGRGSSTYNTNDHSYGGSGVRVGVGYTIPLGEKLGLPIMAHYQYISANSGVEMTSGVLTVGIVY